MLGLAVAILELSLFLLAAFSCCRVGILLVMLLFGQDLKIQSECVAEFRHTKVPAFSVPLSLPVQLPRVDFKPDLVHWLGSMWPCPPVLLGELITVPLETNASVVTAAPKLKLMGNCTQVSF